MSMMQIRVMRVGMMQGRMMVPVRMRLRHLAIMGVLVMVVMGVTVRVVQCLVLVRVGMALREVQP